MKASERLKRIRQIERTVAKLQKKGWCMESVEHTDDAGQPFRTVVRMTCRPKSRERNLM